MMYLLVREQLSKYYSGRISREQLIESLPDQLFVESIHFKNIFEQVIQDKNAEALEGILLLLHLSHLREELIDTLNQLLLEDWHTRYEDIIHEIQRQKNPSSVPFIKEAIKKKHPYLKSYETGLRQFINQCGHALKSIGTEESLRVIYDLSMSDDAIIRDEMLYRISKIDGRNDYQRMDE